MKWEIDFLPVNIFGVFPAPIVHDDMNFQFTYEKALIAYEIKYGYMVSSLNLICNLCQFFMFI